MFSDLNYDYDFDFFSFSTVDNSSDYCKSSKQTQSRSPLNNSQKRTFSSYMQRLTNTSNDADAAQSYKTNSRQFRGTWGKIAKLEGMEDLTANQIKHYFHNNYSKNFFKVPTQAMKQTIINTISGWRNKGSAEQLKQRIWEDIKARSNDYHQQAYTSFIDQ